MAQSLNNPVASRSAAPASSSDSDSDADPPPAQRRAPPADPLATETLPALFLDELPADPSQTDNADLAALAAIKASSTPEELAESHKAMGNEAVQRGVQLRKKFYLRQALEQYELGLAQRAADARLNSALHSNAAHCHLLLANHRAALEAARAAVGLQASNVKAYYRGAKAAIALERFDEAVSLCQQGLAQDPAAAELTQLQQEAGAKAEQAACRRAEAERRATEARAPARRLANLVLQRGWRVGRPQLSIGSRKPYVDEDGRVHWPVMLVYPETMATDAIEDFAETDPICAHLDVMFGPDAPPLQWDTHGEYSREAVQLYVLTHAAKPLTADQLTEVFYGGWPEELPTESGPSRYGPKASEWLPVSEGSTLQDILSMENHIIPGIPVFFVLSRNGDFQQRFLSGDLPLL